MSAEKSHHRSKTSSYAKQRLSFLDQQNISKQKPISPMPSEITVKSYTSRLHIGDPKGNIILRTDQYNRDDFRVVYPNAKFFVIKSFDEADIHKSIKYGVWSTSGPGNRKLDRAFREAQAIAASGSSSCPVFLFFSVSLS
jgi:YTH domain-containing family protein